MKKIVSLFAILFLLLGCTIEFEEEEKSAAETGGDKYTAWNSVPDSNLTKIKYRIHCSAYTYSTGSYWEVQIRNESSDLYVRAKAIIGLPVYNGSLSDNPSLWFDEINPGGEEENIGNTSKDSEVTGVQNCSANYSASIGVWLYDSSWNRTDISKYFDVSQSTETFR